MLTLLLQIALCNDSGGMVQIGNDEFYYYKLSTRELSIRKGPTDKPKSQTLIMPKEISIDKQLFEVVDVFENSFLGTQFEEIILPESVKSIGKSCFAQSKYLKKIDLSQTKITNLPSKCFSDSILSTILLPNTINHLDIQCFKKTQITEFIFTTKMNFGVSGMMCFMCCQNLANVDMSKTKIVSIPKGTFDGCTSLSKIIFSPSVEKFEDSSFRETGLEEIKIPETVQHISEKAFQNCLKLRYVDVSKSMVVSIHKDTFFGCKSLTEFIDDNRIQEISQNSFAGSGIKKYTFRNVVVIEKFCFQSCHFLETADFTNSKVEAIPQGSFLDCISLKNLILPPKILGMSLGAFQGTHLSEIVVPSTIAEIGIKCFADSSHLTLADLTQCTSISIISAYSFYNCSKLSKVYLPQTTRRIHEFAFYGVAIKKLICNSTLRFVNNHCFASSKKLEEVDMHNSQIISISSHCFENCTNLRNIKFSQILSTMSIMCLSGTKITNLDFPDTLKSLEAGALYGCRYLQSADFTKCKLLSKFENASFCNCTRLEFVLFPPTNIRIMNQCFSFSSLRSLKLAKCELIGEHAFYGCRNLEIVNLSSTSVREIPKMAFRKCTKLETIILPKSLRSIGSQAFTRCGFSEIILPNTLIDISQAAFANCTNLKQISVKNTYVTVIPEQLLYGCCNLTNITLTNQIKSIHYQAFSYTNISMLFVHQINSNSIGAFSFMENLKSINISVIEDGYIPDSLFEGCTSLSNISIGSSVTKIGSKAFVGCAILQIKFDKNVKSLEPSVYENCTFLKTADLSQSSVIEIPSNLFMNCINLESVEFSRLTSIFGDNCLSNTAIKEFVFSNYVKNYGKGMFYGCKNLTEVAMKDSVVTLIHPNTFEDCFALEKISLPSKITSIGSKSFKQTSIEIIEIPSEVKIIGKEAFAGCAKLIKVEMEKTAIDEIEQSAFLGCVNLKDVKLPAFVKAIYKSAFAQTAIEYVKIPLSLSTLSISVFDHCESLKEADLSSTNITEIPQYTFFHCTSLEKVILTPKIEIIAKMAFACTSIKEFEGSEKLISIREGAFNNCTKLTKVDLQKSKISLISKNLFKDSYSLSQILLPPELTKIGDSAFVQASFESISIPSMVDNIEKYAFSKSALKTIDLSHTAIHSISPGVFKECKQLVSILFPKATTSIGVESFAGCSAIQNLDLKDTEISTIDIKAFDRCSKLNKVLLASTVTSIGVEAFNNCFNLSTVFYCGKNKVVGKAVFEKVTDVFVTESFPSKYFASIEVSIIENCPENVFGNYTVKVPRSSQRKPISMQTGILITIIIILVFILALLIRLKKKKIPVSRLKDDFEQRTALLNQKSYEL